MKADEARVVHAMRRGATRRELLSMLMADGVAVAASGTVLGRATAAYAATPKMGGRIRAAGFTSSTADTLDPAKASTSTDYVRLCTFYNRLTLLDGTMRPTMELAEEVTSDDAQTWQVKLRSGVTFHDGKSLGAADVVYSLKRHLDPAIGSKVNALAKQMITIEAVDATTVRIVMDQPNADLPALLGLHHFMIIADGTTDFSTANGTGPFKCQEFTPPASVRLPCGTRITGNPKAPIWTRSNSSAFRTTTPA